MDRAACNVTSYAAAHSYDPIFLLYPHGIMAAGNIIMPS